MKEGKANTIRIVIFEKIDKKSKKIVQNDDDCSIMNLDKSLRNNIPKQNLLLLAMQLCSHPIG